MKREWVYCKESLEEAMVYAWENQLTMIVFPVEMNLITVGNYSELDTSYLTKSYVLDSRGFNSLDEMAEYIATTIIGG